MTVVLELLAESDRKRLANAQASAALRGITVHALRGDAGRPEYVATQWYMTRAFSSLDDLAAWLAMVTGKPVEGV